MRKIFIFSLLIGMGMVFGQRPDWMERAKFVRYDDATSTPDFIKFNPGQEIPFSEFHSFLADVLGLSNQDEFRLIKTYADQLGYTHYRYQQYHNGYPVEFGQFIAHVKNGKVVSLNGDYFPMTPTNGQVLTRQAAFDAALRHVGAEEYIWQQPGADNDLKLVTNDPNATYFPTGELVYTPVSWDLEADKFRLAYKFDIYSTRPLDRQDVFVDAQTGDIVLNATRMYAIDSAGTAQTYYNGTQNIIADYTGSNFRLKEAGRGDGVWTRDMNRGTNFGNAVDFIDFDNVWNNVNTQRDHAAPDAHWGAEMTYDYLWNYHGLNSIDDNGFELLMYVHYDNAWSNARWDGQRAMFGDGPANNFPFCVFDVVAHEIGHGTINESANLIYQNESGALNESFADIQGAMVEFTYKPNPNWRIAEDLGTFRSMSNPKSEGDPDTYHGQNWEFTSFDNGGVHINSGVQNYWFYLLSQGGSGTNDNGDSYNVTGITRDSAAAIAFRNLLVYLTPSSQYIDARFYAIQSAIDIYGECSPEMISTVNAWYAVGVGLEWDSLATDFVADETEFCNGPADVAFSNLSKGSITYFWDFGDFNFSSAEHPTHTYNFLGTYSPRLIATGCANAKDTLLRQNYIELNTSLPCTFNMPATGSGGILSDCNGKIRDSGGNGDYLSNVNSTITIAPTNAAQVTLVFTYMDFETSGDLISIYDGPDVASPLIGNFNGNTLPNGGTITSTGGAITIQERTNGVNEKGGFEAEWNCTLVNLDERDLSEKLSVFPNPASDEFRVEFEFPGSRDLEISVTDAFGKQVYASSGHGTDQWGETISSRNWAKGIYFVIVKSDERRITRKLVIQ